MINMKELKKKRFMRIRRVFNRKYEPINTKDRTYTKMNKDGSKELITYKKEHDGFFKTVRKFQIKYGLTQQEAIDHMHDSYTVKKVYDIIKDKEIITENIVVKIEKIISDWEDYEFDIDVGVDFIVDQDGSPT